MNIVFQKDKIGLGKRKRAVARVFLIPGGGNITINKVSGEKYLQYNTNYLNAIFFGIMFSVMNIAVPTPKGTAITNASREVTSVP